jgi:hypothetical protein
MLSEIVSLCSFLNFQTHSVTYTCKLRFLASFSDSYKRRRATSSYSINSTPRAGGLVFICLFEPDCSLFFRSDMSMLEKSRETPISRFFHIHLFNYSQSSSLLRPRKFVLLTSRPLRRTWPWLLNAQMCSR